MLASGQSELRAVSLSREVRQVCVGMDEVWARYESSRKPFVTRYGGMAYRGRGARMYHLINSPSQTGSRRRQTANLRSLVSSVPWSRARKKPHRNSFFLLVILCKCEQKHAAIFRKSLFCTNTGEIHKFTCFLHLHPQIQRTYCHNN